jgi:hypothetical protein
MLHEIPALITNENSMGDVTTSARSEPRDCWHQHRVFICKSRFNRPRPGKQLLVGRTQDRARCRRDLRSSNCRECPDTREDVSSRVPQHEDSRDQWNLTSQEASIGEENSERSLEISHRILSHTDAAQASRKERSASFPRTHNKWDQDRKWIVESFKAWIMKINALLMPHANQKWTIILLIDWKSNNIALWKSSKKSAPFFYDFVIYSEWLFWSGDFLIATCVTFQGPCKGNSRGCLSRPFPSELTSIEHANKQRITSV